MSEKKCQGCKDHEVLDEFEQQLDRGEVLKELSEEAKALLSGFINLMQGDHGEYEAMRRVLFSYAQYRLQVFVMQEIREREKGRNN